MANPHGTPIWYELGAVEPEAAKRFYEAVAPWTVHPAAEGSPVDYRMIDAGDGFVGGLARHDDAMAPPGATPGWRVYFGVDDVDATVKSLTDAGGAVHFGPFDLEGVGRMAFVADPQGNPFYVMRGAGDESSTAFTRGGELGKCSWNELVTTDAVAGNAFYAAVFGWTYPRKMTMPGEMGDYTFIACGGQELGATMKAQSGQPTGWNLYFRVADVEAASEAVKANGGTVHMGPMEVPGGERVIMASDPAGTPVGLVAGQERGA